MIAHTSLHVSDYRKSKAFYIKALAPLGYKNNMEFGESAGFNDGKNTDLWISREPKLVPLHVAFEADSRAKVKAFHKAALAAGARDNGAPGYRDYSPGYYAAFVLDPDGNNIEAVWYDPKPATGSHPARKTAKAKSGKPKTKRKRNAKQNRVAKR